MKPQGTQVATRRLETFLDAIAKAPDEIHLGVFESDLDIDTEMSGGSGEGGGEIGTLLRALKLSVNKSRQGDHRFIHGILHVPEWLRGDVDGAGVAAIFATVLAPAGELLETEDAGQ